VSDLTTFDANYKSSWIYFFQKGEDDECMNNNKEKD